LLSDRKEKIFKIIVEEYIKTAKPVGSSYVCQKLSCSSATVRNEMMQLEDLNLLEKTHTSSGRIPSEQGYRYYVDNLMKPKDLTGEDMLKLQTIFRNNSLIFSDAIKKSIEIVSEITNYTSVVLGASSKDNKLKKVEVVPLNDNKIITMVITDKGYVEHKIMIIPSNIEINEVKKTVDLINKLLIGTPINEISTKLEFEVKPLIPRYVKEHEILYDAFYSAFNEFSNKNEERYFVGKNNFLKQPEFNNIDKVKHLLNKFEEIESIKTSFKDDNEINIYIGKENELSDDVSIIKTTFNYHGEEVPIAIIGPKRMEYDKVVGILNYMKENIDR